MEGLSAAPRLRERRLYQAENLLRKYGFPLGEIPVDGAGRLDLAADPKLA
jgi:predicted DNA-binding helix-hairpin-helix protein